MLIAAACALATASVSPVTAAGPQNLEYEVKAAYIFNLANFTSWPASAFATPAAPLEVCVADPNPFGDLLARTFQNEQVAGHPVVVHTVKDAEEVRSCRVLFVATGADASGALQRAAATGATLTIGETPAFEKRGGIITFVTEGGRVRFRVSVAAASRAGIQLSSKVLQVSSR
jgi:hypothetical protein